MALAGCKNSKTSSFNHTYKFQNENCKAYADTGTPSSPSNTLIDFKSDAYSLPQLFPYPYFSIIVENCDVNFNFSTTLPSNYYTIDSERNGFIFSPTFFNSEADNGYINITFGKSTGFEINRK